MDFMTNFEKYKKGLTIEDLYNEVFSKVFSKSDVLVTFDGSIIHNKDEFIKWANYDPDTAPTEGQTELFQENVK